MSVPGGYAALETAWGVVREQAAGASKLIALDYVKHHALVDSRDRIIPRRLHLRVTNGRRFGLSRWRTLQRTRVPREFVEQ